MESHEGPIYVTAPCYILALDGYTIDPKSGQVAYDEKLQFLAETVGATDEPAVVVFSDRHHAEEYLNHMEEQFGLRPLEIPNNGSFKSFLRLAKNVYRIASIDPDPKTGNMRAGLTIEEVLQNLDFPGVNVL
jgi:hypothetical protein